MKQNVINRALTAIFKTPDSPYLTLLIWVLPIVLLRSSQQSLMAHDEGIYATQARSILQTGDWITPQWGSGYSFDRTIGIQWLIAVCYQLFGTREETARLPSAIAFVISVLLTYRIGVRLLNPRLAWLGAAIFSVIPLVVQYGRLATQDTVLMCVELIGIWALLEAQTVKRRAVLAGAMFGTGFMIKGFMIVPATIALFPYFAGQRRQLLNAWLYGGLGIGLIAPIAWLWAATQKYGNAPIAELFGKLFHLKGQTYQGAGWFYYFWNIPANGFPWVFFALFGLWLMLFHAQIRAFVKAHRARSLLIGYPVVLLIELTLFGTKTHYYPLQLMPFVGLWAAIALDHLAQLYAHGKRTQSLIGLNLAVSGAAIVLLVVMLTRSRFVAALTIQSSAIDSIALVGLVIGIGWLSLSVIWLLRHRVGQPESARQWVAVWLLTSWLALSILHLTGLWGNYDAKLKTFLTQATVEPILRSQAVSFVVNDNQLSRDDRKRYLLLTFYTPRIGQTIDNPKILPNTDYAWIDPNFAKTPGLTYQPIAAFEGWTLGKRWQRAH